MERSLLDNAASFAICALFAAFSTSCRTSKQATEFERVVGVEIEAKDTASTTAAFQSILQVVDTSETSVVIVVEEYDTEATDTTGAHPLKKKSTLQYNSRAAVVVVDSTTMEKESLAARHNRVDAVESASIKNVRTRERFVGYWVFVGLMALIALISALLWAYNKIRSRLW